MAFRPKHFPEDLMNGTEFLLIVLGMSTSAP